MACIRKYRDKWPAEVQRHGHRATHVPASRLNDIVLERRGITPDTALRLVRYFGGEEADAQGWINMQATCTFKLAAKAVGKVIAKEVKPRPADDERFALTA